MFGDTPRCNGTCVVLRLLATEPQRTGLARVLLAVWQVVASVDPLLPTILVTVLADPCPQPWILACVGFGPSAPSQGGEYLGSHKTGGL